MFYWGLFVGCSIMTDGLRFKVLMDNVNLMAMNLTNQVRSIAEVTRRLVVT